MHDSNTGTKTATASAARGRFSFGGEPTISCLLVAHAGPGATAVDRFRLPPLCVIGRSSGADFVVDDGRVSKQHARLTQASDGFRIVDLGSTNGTFVNGHCIDEERPLTHNDVIRIGDLVFVYHEDAGTVLEPMPLDRLNITGDFHSGPLVREIAAAALSDLHILVTGPSGAGKELVASGLSRILYQSKPDAPFVVHNAARFSSEEEATCTLFGVGAKVFSDVAARTGLIEQAHGGTLFLDEVHNLPERVQRTLLRIIEDGRFSRIGDTKKRHVQLRFVLASNAPAPTFGLAHDLLARLRVVKVPSIAERVADIPSIFDGVLKKAVEKLNLDFTSVKTGLNADHYEALCLDRFRTENVRGMLVIADTVATYVGSGMPLDKALAKVFVERFDANPVIRRSRGNMTPISDASGDLAGEADDLSTLPGGSHYEQHKVIILSAFKQARGNVSATLRLLNAKGIKCSRRWLDIYLDKWGIRRRRYRARA